MNGITAGAALFIAQNEAKKTKIHFQASRKNHKALKAQTTFECEKQLLKSCQDKLQLTHYNRLPSAGPACLTKQASPPPSGLKQ
ncbi:hypothetical protein [Chromobacterium amazonense]|uniref:hypothetical protein n=1 Tax=Chromobacterium amazonense TaxID=1382803 RepID=UPI0011B264EA|nr:hypothetical protein [Chromobacterium amazonense]